MEEYIPWLRSPYFNALKKNNPLDWCCFRHDHCYWTLDADYHFNHGDKHEVDKTCDKRLCECIADIDVATISIFKIHKNPNPDSDDWYASSPPNGYLNNMWNTFCCDKLTDKKRNF